MSRIPESGFFPVVWFFKLHIWNLHVMENFPEAKIFPDKIIRIVGLLNNDMIRIWYTRAVLLMFGRFKGLAPWFEKFDIL